MAVACHSLHNGIDGWMPIRYASCSHDVVHHIASFTSSVVCDRSRGSASFVRSMASPLTAPASDPNSCQRRPPVREAVPPRGRRSLRPSAPPDSACRAASSPSPAARSSSAGMPLVNLAELSSPASLAPGVRPNCGTGGRAMLSGPAPHPAQGTRRRPIAAPPGDPGPSRCALGLQAAYPCAARLTHQPPSSHQSAPPLTQ